MLAEQTPGMGTGTSQQDGAQAMPRAALPISSMVLQSLDLLTASAASGTWLRGLSCTRLVVGTVAVLGVLPWNHRIIWVGKDL